MKKYRLFCLPYAGGSSTVIYNKWRKYLLSSIDLIPIELSGRGRRINELFYSDIQEAVDDIYSMIVDSLDMPYSFYGHSMGTILAYEVTMKIINNGHRSPCHLFLSGRYPPHIRKEKNLSNASDEEFKKEILSLGGTSKEILEDNGLMKMFLPIIRADYRIVESYRFKNDNKPFDFGITIFNGNDDEDVTEIDLEAWKEYTTKRFSCFKFKGGHFFINDEENQKRIVNIISNNIYRG